MHVDDDSPEARFVRNVRRIVDEYRPELAELGVLDELDAALEAYDAPPAVPDWTRETPSDEQLSPHVRERLRELARLEQHVDLDDGEP